MKPKYIFSAVFAICLIMGGLLPRLGMPSHAVAMAPAAALTAAHPTRAATLSPTAVLPAATMPPLPLAPTRAAPTLAPTQPPAVPAPAQQAAAQSPDLAATAPANADTNSVGAAPVTASLPDLDSFTKSLTNGQASLLVGVYVPGLFALPVVQQPAGDEEFVSAAEQALTQYSLPASYGVVGLLAHNTLSGYNFFRLQNGQDVVLIYGDGRQARFKIAASQRYQALSPYDAHSSFVDLNGPGGQVMNYQQVFDRVYTHTNQLVFQTCFTANGDPSWGRVFYIANPA